MNEPKADVKALTEALEAFTRSSKAMEESYRLLQERIERLDRELADKNRELALTSDYLNNTLESMSEGVVVIDTEGVITKFNRAAAQVLGIPREEAVGSKYGDVFGREFAASPKGRYATEITAKDGRSIPVSERDSPIFDKDDQRIGTVKVFEDLSELEYLREQVRQKDRLAALGEMAATVAHEIRNPLGGIKGFAALLARDVDSDDPRSRLIEKILVGTSELNSVVSDLLEYTRPIQLRLTMATCGEVLDPVLRAVDIEKENISIINNAQADIRVIVDSLRIRQALLNILLNAVQSVDSGGRVSITTSIDDGFVVIAVADDGCGIPPDLLEKVFSPFFTTKEKGTGLGLAVAAKIVEVHGGKLWVESEQGKGTTFFLRLPRVE